MEQGEVNDFWGTVVYVVVTDATLTAITVGVSTNADDHRVLAYAAKACAVLQPEQAESYIHVRHCCQSCVD